MSSTAFTPIDVGPLRLRNRTVRSAAFEGMSPGGDPSQALQDYHESVARGGVGMTTVAYAAVRHDGLTFGHQIWMRDEVVEPLRKLTDAVHRHGAAASLQLGHAGNLASEEVTGKRPMAPSKVFNLAGPSMPRAMSTSDIESIIEAYGNAALLAREAGFDAVEVHMGHGYLISQFLSPFTNRRDDTWGGSLKSRARLARHVAREVRKAIGPEVALVAKTNTRDGFGGGMERDEAVEVAAMVESEGVDAFVLSGGFVSKSPMYLMRGDVPRKELAQMQPSWLKKMGVVFGSRLILKDHPFEEAYFLRDALAFREALAVPLFLVGGIRSVATIDRVLKEGLDGVAMARPLIMEPDLVGRMERGEAEASKCHPCNRCMATMYYGQARCTEL